MLGLLELQLLGLVVLLGFVGLLGLLKLIGLLVVLGLPGLLGLLGFLDLVGLLGENRVARIYMVARLDHMDLCPVLIVDPFSVDKGWTYLATAAKGPALG